MVSSSMLAYPLPSRGTRETVLHAGPKSTSLGPRSPRQSRQPSCGHSAASPLRFCLTAGSVLSIPRERANEAAPLRRDPTLQRHRRWDPPPPGSAPCPSVLIHPCPLPPPPLPPAPFHPTTATTTTYTHTHPSPDPPHPNPTPPRPTPTPPQPHPNPALTPPRCVFTARTTATD